MLKGRFYFVHRKGHFNKIFIPGENDKIRDIKRQIIFCAEDYEYFNKIITFLEDKLFD